MRQRRRKILSLRAPLRSFRSLRHERGQYPFPLPGNTTVGYIGSWHPPLLTDAALPRHRPGRVVSILCSAAIGVSLFLAGNAHAQDCSPEMFDSFTGKPQGAPAASDSGHPWTTFGATPMTVNRGRLVSPMSGDDVQGGYAQTQLDGQVQRAGATFSLTPYSEPIGGGAVLLLYEDDYSEAYDSLVNIALHLYLGPTYWNVDVVDLASPGSPFDSIGSGYYEKPLLPGATYSVEVQRVEDTTFEIHLPGGEVVSVSDPRIDDFLGSYASWQSFAMDPSTEAHAAFSSVWADTEQCQEKKGKLKAQSSDTDDYFAAAFTSTEIKRPKKIWVRGLIDRIGQTYEVKWDLTCYKRSESFQFKSLEGSFTAHGSYADPLPLPYRPSKRKSCDVTASITWEASDEEIPTTVTVQIRALKRKKPR